MHIVETIFLSTSVFLTPYYDKSLKLAVDASGIGAGAVLLQEDSNGVYHPDFFLESVTNIRKTTLRLQLGKSALHLFLLFSIFKFT